MLLKNIILFLTQILQNTVLLLLFLSTISTLPSLSLKEALLLFFSHSLYFLSSDGTLNVREGRLFIAKILASSIINQGTGTSFAKTQRIMYITWKGYTITLPFGIRQAILAFVFLFF